MKLRYLVLGFFGLLTSSAYGQYASPSPANAVPSIDSSRGRYTPPEITNTVPIVRAIPDVVPSNPNAATIGPRRDFPRAPSPTDGGSGLDGSDMSQLGENMADSVANRLKDGTDILGSRAMRGAARVVGSALGVVNTISTIDKVEASLYRADECERRGDQAGADSARARARYDAIGLHPLGGALQLCAKAIGNMMVGRDIAAEFAVRYIEGNIRYERELNARFAHEPYPWELPVNSQARSQGRRSSMFDSMRHANEQAAANRAAMAQESGAWNDPQFTQMMWMLAPAAIAASQPRAVQSPIAAPQSPLPPLEWQTQCYGDGRNLATGAMGRTHCQQVPVYPGRAPRNDVPPPGATVDTRTWPR